MFAEIGKISNEKDANTPKLLVGTRNGDILEATLSCFFSGLTEQKNEDSDSDDEENKIKGDRIEANWELLLRSH